MSKVGQISRALKALTMEIDVPILALSQLNRLSEGTQSKAPTMSEMKESGDIEQDADAINPCITQETKKIRPKVITW